MCTLRLGGAVGRSAGDGASRPCRDETLAREHPHLHPGATGCSHRRDLKPGRPAVEGDSPTGCQSDGRPEGDVAEEVFVLAEARRGDVGGDAERRDTRFPPVVAMQNGRGREAAGRVTGRERRIARAVGSGATDGVFDDLCHSLGEHLHADEITTQLGETRLARCLADGVRGNRPADLDQGAAEHFSAFECAVQPRVFPQLVIEAARCDRLVERLEGEGGPEAQAQDLIGPPGGEE